MRVDLLRASHSRVDLLRASHPGWIYLGQVIREWTYLQNAPIPTEEYSGSIPTTNYIYNPGRQ